MTQSVKETDHLEKDSGEVVLCGRHEAVECDCNGRLPDFPDAKEAQKLTNLIKSRR